MYWGNIGGMFLTCKRLIKDIFGTCWWPVRDMLGICRGCLMYSLQTFRNIKYACKLTSKLICLVTNKMIHIAIDLLCDIKAHFRHLQTVLNLRPM